jgi:hypothetical protein
MDAKARKSLIDSLAGATNFEASMTEPNRRWFVGKVIDVYQARGESDAAIKTKTGATVTRAKTAATKHRDFKISIKFDSKEKATERGLRSRRAQILYGLIAYDPELADTANEAQFLFVAKRRYRSIERFQFFINPNGRGYLRYPDTCPANLQWRVNVDANTLWKHADPTTNYPILMVTPPNPPDVVKALDKLFVAKKNPCEGNIFDCATALSFVYMDALLEAKSPKTLFDELWARNPPVYLCIFHVHGTIGSLADLTSTVKRNGFFLTDMRATTLFTKDHIPQEDLQVGDHIYIHNHGLYKTLRPHGAWQGEHALVTDFGNRKTQDDAGFRFMGHGMPRGGETGAIPRFYGNLLNELNTLLYRQYRMGGIFLAYKKSGDTLFPAKVTKQTATAIDWKGNLQTVDFYFFDLDFKYRNMLKKPPRGKTFAEASEHGFVAWHIAATREFGIHVKKTIAEARTAGIRTKLDGVRFTRFNPPGTPTEMFDAVEWSIPYLGPNDEDLLYSVYRKKGAAVEAVLVEMWELYSEPFLKLDASLSGIFATRLKVDTSAAYTSFLTSKGAI